MCRAEGGNLGKGTSSQMKRKFSATLLPLCCCPAVFAEPLARASYEGVCEQMDHQGISSRTQPDPNSQHLVDNLVVVVGAGPRSSRKQAPTAANSKIIVGASMTEINTESSSFRQDSGLAARSADPCG